MVSTTRVVREHTVGVKRRWIDATPRYAFGEGPVRSTDPIDHARTRAGTRTRVGGDAGSVAIDA